MTSMFNGASSFDVDISNWQTARVQSATAIFDHTAALSNCTKGHISAEWAQSNISTAFDGSRWMTYNADPECAHKLLGTTQHGPQNKSMSDSQMAAAVASWFVRCRRNTVRRGCVDIATWQTSEVKTLKSLFKGTS
jgi:surface protein